MFFNIIIIIKKIHTYTQTYKHNLHQYSRFSLKTLFKMPNKKQTITKTRKPAKFSFFSNGRSQAGKIFFVLSQTRVRRGYLAFRLPASTNGLLLSVKADF